MTDQQDEPAENISGGDAGGGTFAAFDDRDGDRAPETRAEAVVDALGEMYWQKAYGGQDGFECLVRTILSQNTSDKASQPAHDSLMERYGPADELAESVADAQHDELAETIASAGLYNQKSAVIIDAAEWVLEEYGSTEGFDRFVREGDPGEVRETLLSVNGVGPKTADCVLLFSGGRGGVFPVDTHVHRIARRMGLAPPDADHETVREHLERDVPAEKCGFGREDIANSYNSEGESDDDEFHNGGTYTVDGEEVTFADGGVPPEKCGFGHTSMIQFGREYCKARKPACLEGPEACPLYDLCDRVGIDEIEGKVVDPAETVTNT
ncbi:endonuclease III domain-containing protein [Salinigranum sp. GCM10025319]|uniref:endonuclease III domain-containing protein n=1 Tax=Salinigranum sp. GCM10025319 TaxID=3252687 RepID=UPI00361BAA31